MTLNEQRPKRVGRVGDAVEPKIIEIGKIHEITKGGGVDSAEANGLRNGGTDWKEPESDRKV